MAKRDYELRPNRSHLTSLIFNEGLSESRANGRKPQMATESQIEYLEFLSKKLEDAGVPYPKPNIESLVHPFGSITINPNRRLVAKKKIAYLQTLAKQNGVDLSEWVRHTPKKEVYKPYSAGAVAIKRLSVRKG